MASVKLTDVKKVYDNKVTAVHDFNLEIKDKEFVVFVGPSGCGKSTTLRMIAGLEEISGGTVEIDGEVVNDLQPKDRDIAMVFQNYALYPHMSVYDNIAFSLRLKHVPEDEIYTEVTKAAEILGITDYLMRKPRALSGGQRQRVAIGRAMVRKSKVFLMDEPLSNLDAKLRNQMRAEIILLRQKLDTTFIYVTHDQTEAMTLGDRIVIMKDGVIQQVGTPTEVFEKPCNYFVAGFIGSPTMNFCDAKLTKEGGKYFVNPFGVKMEVGGTKGKILADRNVSEGNVIFGVRPEHIVISDGKDSDAGSILVTLEVNEMMGSELHLHVVAGDDSRIVLRVPTLGMDEAFRESLVYGKKLGIRFDSSVMQLFDKESEKSLFFA
ncbi:MAG: sn-glycerol-3-phosphate ABC transporter ATP-binding protein UgpC [Lachnospiraceae bacterium]|nr:sn-glycerol-3-phosphate ABC transporter ATP-binding protein UgpC [Lachnospiraceae bacterium]